MTANEDKLYAPLLWAMGGLCVATGVALLVLMLGALIGPFRFFGKTSQAADGSLGLWTRGPASSGPSAELERRLEAWRKATTGDRSCLESTSLAQLSAADVEVVVVPDARDLEGEEIAQLRAYLEAGGGAVLTGVVGALAQDGGRGETRSMARLLQVRRVERVDHAASSSVAAARRGPLSSALAPGEQIPLMPALGMPAIDDPQAELRWAAGTRPGARGASKRLRVGRGRLVWLATGPESAVELGTEGWYPMARLVRAAIAWAARKPSLELLAWPNAAPFAATLRPLDAAESRTSVRRPTPGELERVVRNELAEAEATGDLARLSFGPQALGEPAATGLKTRVVAELAQRGAWLASPEELETWTRTRSQIDASLRRVGPQRLLLSVTNRGPRPARSVALRLHLNRATASANVDRTLLQQEAPRVRLRRAEQQLDLTLPELPGGTSSAYVIDYEPAEARPQSTPASGNAGLR